MTSHINKLNMNKLKKTGILSKRFSFYIGGILWVFFLIFVYLLGRVLTELLTLQFTK